MLRTAYSRPHVFKAFSSSLILDPRVAGRQADLLTGAAGNTNINIDDSSINSNLPSPTISTELRRIENKHIKPLISASEWHFLHPKPTSKIREYLENGQYSKLLIKLSVDNHLNDVHMSDLLSNGSLTKSEYSLFINKLLSEGKLDIKLSNVIPDTPHTELIYKLYELYRDHVVDHSRQSLTPLELYDLNLFLRTFIKEAQLSKAQKVLDFVLQRKPLDKLLKDADVNILIQYLRLRCGAISTYWKIQPASQKNSKETALGKKASGCHLAKSYKFQDDETLLQIINSVLGEPDWKERRSIKLDSTIVYSLGYLGEIDLIEKYVTDTWFNPSSDGRSQSYPNSELLVAILTSYCTREGGMKGGLEVLDRFMKAYPDLELDPLFWRRLFQLSSLLWDRKSDRKATLFHGCWDIMKQWHVQKSRRLPYDYGIVKELYPVFVRTRDKKGALEVLTRMFFGAFVKPESLLRPNELSLLCKYQKFILKMFALKGNYGKGLEFCKEWSFSGENKLELDNYFLEWHRVYEQRRLLKSERKIASQTALQRRYDDMEEDDMLLGRLW